MKKLLLLGLFFIVVCSHIFANDNFIVPGKRVNGYYLGMKKQQIINSFGKPSSKEVGAGGHILNMKYDDYGFTFNIATADGEVCGIDVENTGYQTKEGIRVGSSYADVVETYGAPKKTSQFGPFIAVSYNGIIFKIDISLNSTVTMISLTYGR